MTKSATPSPAIYNRIGTRYDTTRRADPYLLSRLLHHLQPKPRGKYLDLACGSGNYTAALARAGISMVGIDQSSQMIRTAISKSTTVKYCLASAESLPISNAAFDGVTCTLAIHHFKDLNAAMCQVARVLCVTGRFVLFTSTRQQMRACWLAEYFPNAIKRSIDQMPDLDQVVTALQHGGLKLVCTEQYSICEDLQDKFLYSGKHFPEMYLDPNFRANISTFSALADPAEVDMGCQRLAADIATGRITSTMESYRNDAGDYLFVVAQSDLK
jgi:ubiquinone/menaquinone biosynthesis C-methylase UbiE